MTRRVLVTGAAGFIGSAVVLDLARDHEVTAVDIREPGPALREAAPGVAWHVADVGDIASLAAPFEADARTHGRTECVIHLAAFYHFDTDWRPEYRRTNLDGTQNVVALAIRHGAERLLFASSMLAMEPPAPGESLTHLTEPSGRIPYGKSKALGEAIVAEATALPSVVLRMGGVFSDWCELPPLHSLIELWSRSSPASRVMVGRGNTGMPYVHRDDLVRLVRECVSGCGRLGHKDVLVASQDGAVRHRELFRAMHGDRRPLRVSSGAARVGIVLARAFGWLTGNAPYERPWMMEYADRPWVADASHTRATLGWSCSSGLGLLDRLPTLLENARRDRPTWDARNRTRKAGTFHYMPAD